MQVSKKTKYSPGGGVSSLPQLAEPGTEAESTAADGSSHQIQRHKKNVWGRKLAGSYTVEAAFLFPIIILVLAFVLRLTIGLYVTVREAAEDTESVTELDTREMFLDSAQIQNFLENLTD